MKSSQNIYEDGVIITSLLQMGKMDIERSINLPKFTQVEWWSWGFHLGRPLLEPELLTSVLGILKEAAG